MPDDAPGGSPQQPLYFKLLHDDAGQIRWGRVLIMLGLTVASAYLSAQTQRTASSPDVRKTLLLGLAQKRIVLGRNLQRIGKGIEDEGWSAYETIRDC